MTFRSKLFFAAALVLLAAGSLLAQGTTGTLTGVVTQDGNPLPGVTVSIASPNLQGQRSTVTNNAGGYNFGALPPGDYTVRFELAGLQTTTQRVHVSVAQNARADARLTLESLAEAITVTATATAVAETSEVQTTFDQKQIEELPIGRTITAITGLAPGVVSGVNGFSISGGQSFDNLYTVDGAVIQENLRGQPHNLFIEDAIQETTVQTAGVSAEFGNFTGGVVNAITRSGGNEFSGSFRDSLTNPKWQAKSEQIFRLGTNAAPEAVVTPNPIDKFSHQFEATLGGRILRDRLWFFLAGRQRERESTANFASGGSPYARSTNDERREAKVTAAITAEHNLVATYLEAPIEATNDCQGSCFDATSLDPSVKTPNDFLSVFYNGVITNSFLVEAKYARVNFAFVGFGGDDRDRITGTPFRLTAPGFNSIVNEPIFCGICGDENRDNDTIGAKLTYYLGTTNFGSHSLVAGADRWHETRLANNYQTPSGFIFFASSFAPVRTPDGRTLVSVRGGASGNAIQYYDIRQLSLGSDLNTTAYYLNDKWDLNSKIALQLGVRYDQNDSTDSAGNKVAQDSKISPRLGVSYDPFGNGRLRLMATYGTYTGRLAETVAGVTSVAGNNAIFATRYQGADILNVSPEEALRQIFAWFDSQGGVRSTPIIGQSIPGSSTQLRGTLDSPGVDEWTIGASTQLGTAGFLRADIIHRDWNDFYGGGTNLNNGKVTLPGNRQADVTLIYNSNDFERTYNAFQLQGQYRLWRRLNLGGNYTYSRLEGNIVGEDSGGGPFAAADASHHPEYRGFPQHLKSGPLESDQPHKLRAWAGIDFATFLGNFNVTALQNFDAGTPYSLSTSGVDVRPDPNFYGAGRAGGITNPGYITPPTTVNYFFSDRGEFRFDDSKSTDLALNYNSNPSWLRGASFFMQGEVRNVFDEQAMVGHNTSVQTSTVNPAACTPNPTAAGCLQKFNPIAGDQPVEGVHWRKGPLFGRPTAPTNADQAGHFQAGRRYFVSAGIRF